MKIFAKLGAAALVTTMSACSQSGAPAENASGMNEVNDMNAMAMDATNPFADVEVKMDRAMTAAVGVSPSDTWVRKMIEHHRGAVDMSRIALARGVTGDVAKMAQTTIDMQGKEIADLQKMVATGTPVPASAELYKPASMTMHNDMMAAKGADLSEIFLRKMLAHHKGAVAMSDVALTNGATGAVRAQIEKTKATQRMEITMVEAMLRGEPMMTMAPAPTKAGAAKTTANPGATSKPVAAQKAAKPKTAEPAADPHAGMDMNNM